MILHHYFTKVPEIFFKKTFINSAASISHHFPLPEIRERIVTHHTSHHEIHRWPRNHWCSSSWRRSSPQKKGSKKWMPFSNSWMHSDFLINFLIANVKKEAYKIESSWSYCGLGRAYSQATFLISMPWADLTSTHQEWFKQSIKPKDIKQSKILQKQTNSLPLNDVVTKILYIYIYTHISASGYGSLSQAAIKQANPNGWMEKLFLFFPCVPIRPF